MAESIRITTPFTEEMSRKLKAGDSVLITGTIISARDAAHKVMTEALARGEKLPLSIISARHRQNPATRSALAVRRLPAEWTLIRRQCWIKALKAWSAKVRALPKLSSR